MEYQKVAIKSITNTRSVNSQSGVVFESLLKLNLSENLLFPPDLFTVRFTRGSTLTLVKSDTILSSSSNKLVLDDYNVARIYGKRYDNDYYVKSLDLPGSLLHLLRNNGRPLPVFKYNSNENSIILRFNYDLEDNLVEYLPDTGYLSLVSRYENYNPSEYINSHLKSRYLDDLYSSIETLDLAWSESEDLGFKGQLKIAEELFKLLDYKDENKDNEIPANLFNRQDSTIISKANTRLNVFRIEGFRQELAKKGQEQQVKEPQKNSFNLLLTNIKEEQGLIRAIFTTDNLELKVGDRFTVNTPDYTKSFEIVIEQIENKVKIGFVIFNQKSADLRTENLLNITGGNFIVGDIRKSDEIFNLLVKNKAETGSISSEMRELIQSANKSVETILIGLKDKQKEVPSFLYNSEDSLYPPGIGNSPRSNLVENLSEGYKHLRDLSPPYPPENYCRRFENDRNCAKYINSVILNNRSDNKNRQAIAIPYIQRYSRELPLGVIPVTSGVNKVIQEYLDYWELYQNKEPVGGCLQLSSDLIPLCYAVRRCCKRNLIDKTRVLQCAKETLEGVSVK